MASGACLEAFFKGLAGGGSRAGVEVTGGAMRAAGARPPVGEQFFSAWLRASARRVKGEKNPKRTGIVVQCVIWDLVGGQNGPIKCWTKILAETLAPLLLGIDIDFRSNVQTTFLKAYIFVFTKKQFQKK
jgi:hypothetical protein